MTFNHSTKVPTDLQRESRLSHVNYASIRKSEYGAIIEFTNGRRVPVWDFALDEPVMIEAIRQARRDGAGLIVIDTRDPS